MVSESGQTYELAIFETIKCNFEFAAADDDEDDGNLPYQSILVNVGPLHLFCPLACQHHRPSQNIQVLLKMKKKKTHIYHKNSIPTQFYNKHAQNHQSKSIYSQQVSTINTLRSHTSRRHKANDSDSPLHYIKHAVKSVRPRGQWSQLHFQPEQIIRKQLLKHITAGRMHILALQRQGVLPRDDTCWIAVSTHLWTTFMTSTRHSLGG